MAIDQFRAELRIKENEIEPTVLNKLLANFVFVTHPKAKGLQVCFVNS